jgi:hypothetical protein
MVLYTPDMLGIMTNKYLSKLKERNEKEMQVARNSNNGN